MEPLKLKAPTGKAAAAALIAACLGAGAAAFAQIPPVLPAPVPTPAALLASEIERDGSCADAEAMGDLRRRLLLANSVTAADIGHALAMLVASPTACAPIKTAAATLAEAYPQPPGEPALASADPLQTAPAVDPAEAQRVAAAALKFVVGPPPRHMTKGRTFGN